MPHAENSALGQEWATVQNNYEQYEMCSLLIKLGSTALFVSCLALGLHVAVSVAVLLVLWVQEGIIRTGQSRLGERILRVEQMLRESASQLAPAFQLHTEWQTSRPGFGGLMAEYVKNMLRPTVAFPYVVLVVIDLGWSMFL